MTEKSNWNLAWKCLHSYESPTVGVRIMVATKPEIDEYSDEVVWAAYRAQETLLQNLIAQLNSLDPKEAEKAAQERAELIGLFPQPIYVEEIPNGYCSQGCCRHLPWFIVTTTIGRFKIGWRKRVIQIDWSDTKADVNANGLFPDEQVTREGQMIHAWSLEKAGEYIRKVIASVEVDRTA